MPLFFLLLQAGLAVAQTAPANLELLNRTLHALAVETARHIDLPDSAGLHYAAARESAAWDWLFERALYDELSVKRGLRLHRVEAAVSEWPLLFYAPLELRIRYDHHRAGSGRSVRRATARLYVKYQDPTGELIFSSEVERTLVDTIRSDQIAALEDHAYPFTAGERTPPSRLKRILEPLLLTAITGGIIYLFYSFRSN